jgi:mannose-6-phosphate isomerase
VTEPALTPLRFVPSLQHRLWGGRRLGELFGWVLPDPGPCGEAWVLSDRDDYPSRVADGPFQGWTIRQVLEAMPDRILGRQARQFRRFPLLLKFIDARDLLSVQVHPSDRHAELLPPGERGKTEAWLILESGPEARIWAGLQPGVGPAELRQSLDDRSVADKLASFHPQPGDGIFLRAGTVHAVGGVVMFEVQQNSDVTFRLYDFDRIDAQTGQPRPLHVPQSLACIDFSRGPVGPVAATLLANSPARRERLFDCEFFRVDRLTSTTPFPVGAADACRIIVGIQGRAKLEPDMGAIQPGLVLLVPAELGVVHCSPDSETTLLEIAIP